MQKFNFDALIKNAEYIRKIANGAKLCAVVKCDAYGHGLERTARHLVDSAHCFAVGNITEANAIAHLGRDILILLPCNRQDCICAVKYRYIITVDSFTSLKNAIDAALLCNCPARVHIKIDSGMHRLGFLPQDLSQVVQYIINNASTLSVEGVYSHFSSADSDANYTQKQYNCFMKCCNYLQTELNTVLTKHIANTAAVFADNKYALDMVRVGLGLYGYGDEGLSTVKSVYANVLSVKKICKGDFISYGNTFFASKNMKVAVIETGYATGFLTDMSQPHFVFNGNTLPVIGRVCMAMSIVDASNVEIKPFDKVTILGDGVFSSHTNDLAIYRLLCNLH